ncbi:MAG: AAA family ATPase [Proteobacteria bacterium]|nr:AAA family ATPase [Pseudomonadota bacterium]
MDPLAQTLSTLDTILLGKPQQLRLCLACLLARGHLLLEDMPGVGKTTLAHALARVLGLQWQRVQFTSDLLPADLLGVSVFERNSQQFEFRPGPLFTQVLVADEINRASPRTQSALLEAMEERQVSIDGQRHGLPEPFFVVATQNPHDQRGTFPLPESQLDRFLMRVTLGYPPASQERLLLAGQDPRAALAAVQPVISAAQLLQLQAQAAAVHVSAPLLDYVQALLAWTRDSGRSGRGLSPRAGVGLLRAARAWALVQGRDAVLPEDVQAVLPAIAAHRLLPQDGSSDVLLIQTLLAAVPVPD